MGVEDAPSTRSGSAADGAIPVVVWLPVGVVATVLAVVVLQLTDAGSGVAFLVIALAMGAVVPVSALLVRRRG